MALELKPQSPARQPVPGLNELVNRFRPRRRATARDRMFFTEQLALLLEMDEKREALHRTMVSALSYPAFLLVFALANEHDTGENSIGAPATSTVLDRMVSLHEAEAGGRI